MMRLPDSNCCIVCGNWATSATDYWGNVRVCNRCRRYAGTLVQWINKPHLDYRDSVEDRIERYHQDAELVIAIDHLIDHVLMEVGL